MPRSIWFVVPAAGASRRMAAAIPKPYLPLAGKTVLEHSLAPLLAHPRIRGGVVVTAADDRRWSALPPALRDRVQRATGGPERAHSVLNGLRALAAAGDHDWVLVHDAARPCLSAPELDALIGACEDDEVGGLLAVPLADTLKRDDAAGRVQATVDRAQLWRALTPQMFSRQLLLRALESALAGGQNPSDEAAAVEHLGLAPRLVEGSSLNVKITRPADLAFAESVISARGSQS